MKFVLEILVHMGVDMRHDLSLRGINKDRVSKQNAEVRAFFTLSSDLIKLPGFPKSVAKAGMETGPVKWVNL
jgi:hypothetical protein